MYYVFCFVLLFSHFGGENVLCITLFECFVKHRKVLIPNIICIFIKHNSNGTFFSVLFVYFFCMCVCVFVLLQSVL